MSEETSVPLPTNERSVKGKPYSAPGVSATHESGVLYQGEFETVSDGTAQAVRLHARALAAAGVPVLLRSFSNVVVNSDGVAEPVHLVGLPPEVDAEVGALTKTSISKPKPVIRHMVIRSAEHLRQAIVPRGAVADPGDLAAQIRMRDGIYGNTIVYSVWERDRVDDATVRQLARVGQCWVPCVQNAEMLVASGVPQEKVHVVPHPYSPDDQIHMCRKRNPGTHGEWKRFYSIGRWEPRKGFVELIRSFLHGFGPRDKASLTIKYSGTGEWIGYPKAATVLEELFDQDREMHGEWTLPLIRQRVRIEGGRVPRSQIIGYHLRNNIYVSSSHGEAWNLSAFDAKIAGNRVVHVPYGGTRDYCSIGDVKVEYRMAPVHSSYKWEADAQWASYGTGELTAALRKADSPASFDADERLMSDFSLDAVGRRMRLLIENCDGE